LSRASRLGRHCAPDRDGRNKSGHDKGGVSQRSAGPVDGAGAPSSLRPRATGARGVVPQKMRGGWSAERRTDSHPAQTSPRVCASRTALSVGILSEGCRASQRSIAAISRLGAVLPGADRGHSAHPDPSGFRRPSSAPRPAIEGRPP
jgi:hypothetical protein